MPTSISLIKPDDWHLHLRQDEALEGYVKDAEIYFEKVLVMPNTLPPVDSVTSLSHYKSQIENAASSLKPYMTFKLLPSISPDNLMELKNAGAVGGKLYPAGVTTNAEDGVSQIEQIFPHLEVMQDLDLVLNIHGEEPLGFCLNRERDYLSQVAKVQKNFPKLRVVLEHISDGASVDFIEAAPENFSASITVHHLFLTLDDVIGGSLRPHHFCKPIAKTPEDKLKIGRAALSGSPKFFLGTDSAPHLKEHKESDCGCAGVYTTPVALPLLAEFFEAAEALPKMEAFCSEFGSEFYKLPLNKTSIELKKESWQVPAMYHGVVPFRAGQILSWK